MTDTGEIHEVPGSVLDCYCPKCDNTTEHTVVSATKRRVRSVKCEVCLFAHNYSNQKQKPTGKSGSSGRGKKKKQNVETSPAAGAEWEEEIEEKKSMEPVDYRLGGQYAEGTIIKHPKFGMGIVKKKISDTKIESLFRYGRKYLVQNIKD